MFDLEGLITWMSLLLPPNGPYGRTYLRVCRCPTVLLNYCFSPPTLVVLKDRGKTLRFYRAGQIRLSDEVLYQFLKEEGWRHKEPWKSAYGPGGNRLA